MPSPSDPTPSEPAGGPAPSAGRTSVVLNPAVTDIVNELGAKMGSNLGPTEVLRRGLILLDMFLSLAPNEELAIHNTETERLERVDLHWDTI